MCHWAVSQLPMEMSNVRDCAQRATGKAHQRVEGCWAGMRKSRALGPLKRGVSFPDVRMWILVWVSVGCEINKQLFPGIMLSHRRWECLQTVLFLYKMECWVKGSCY